MLRPLLGLLAALAAFPVAAAPSMPARTLETSAAIADAFRAPSIAPVDLARLAPPLEKAAAPSIDDAGRLRTGPVRAIEGVHAPLAWTPLAGGYVTRFRVTSESSQGLRTKLVLDGLDSALELRARGDTGPIETERVDPALGNVAWTPWTEGASQVVELFSALPVAQGAVRVTALAHFDVSLVAKAAGACTIPTMCSTGFAAIDAAVAQRKKSVMRLSFIDGGSGFYCSGTLINTERFPAPYILTAHHCMDAPEVAQTVTTMWFYENPTCDASAPVVGQMQVAGGAELVFRNFNIDSSLIRLNAPPPPGAVYSAWNAARLATGDAIVSISHPAGDTSRLALGGIEREYRVNGTPQDMYGVRFTSGIIQGGSSGSGLFTLNGTSLELRGVLSGTTVRNPGGMSCTNMNESALYPRLELFMPEILPFITTAGRAADDAPNRVQDYPQGIDGPLDEMPAGLTFARRIDYAGDVDLYRFSVSALSYVSAWTEGPNLDTVGNILDVRGVSLEANDDAQVNDNHFGITRQLGPGTYYAQVTHFDADGTGAYTLRLHAARVDANYTDLWWNPAEPGWGINVNHQGNILFATLFTYDRSGAPMWLVMSNGAKQADGSYSGALYRATGTLVGAATFGPVSLTPVGTMTLAFPTTFSGTLTYTVDGARVTKSINRQLFSTQATCTWSGFDRSYATNFQDLWWNPYESGWGLNIAHQGSTLFATLFTYARDGTATWYVMSSGQRSVTGGFTGTLYRTTGPAFDASPWTPATVTPVGTMQLNFEDGNTGALTYSVDGFTVTRSIQRQVFSMPKTECES